MNADPVEQLTLDRPVGVDQADGVRIGVAGIGAAPRGGMDSLTASFK